MLVQEARAPLEVDADARSLLADKPTWLGFLPKGTILSEDPYPVKAYIAFRHDPLLSLPDPEAQKKALDKLDLLVALDSRYSETGWYADVLLPSATYLE